MSPRKAAPSPARLGYRMPAEWEPHEATWIAWPHQGDDWPGRLGVVRWTFVEIVRQLARGETVEILFPDRRQARHAMRRLEHSHVELDRVRAHLLPTDRSWMRDSGPTFVRRSGSAPADRASVALIQWKFNAWAKYPDWHRDRRVPPWIGRHLGRPLYRARWRGRWVTLEGGAIDVDGAGLLLATEACLLGGPNVRNPGLGRAATESALRANLGIEEVVWLGEGIDGDDTQGHIDDLARFVGPASVLVVSPYGEDDENRGVLEQNRDRLERFRTRHGRRLVVRELPSPRPVVYRGQRLPASYANFYVANGSVLVPTFDDPHDGAAMDVLRGAFPDREVVGIRSRDLVWGLGTIHCLTQQQPAAVGGR
ncbi:MAG TPA: agmatine deiminase family protein [Thermoplasmata archaeon]|nr:agmatine deiminase family protein [Thermoplasmata archaeon]